MASQSLPKTMKGVIIEKTGGVEVLQYKADLAVPEPKDGQVLVKNDYVGINYIDTYFRSGLYPAPSYPYMLGREAEGTIVATGPDTPHGLKTGDRVVYLSEATYAEYTAAPAAKAIKIPSGIEPTVASAALLQGLTALTLIREAYNVQKGDWILVHAAAGGVGLWLCQLLAAVGAKTIATASTQEKLDLAKKAGAQVLINYSHEDVKAKVDEVTNKQGVAAVFDGVGKSTFDLSLDCLARKGTMASFGNASGAVPPFAISRLGAKNAKVLRPTLFNYIATRDEFEQYTNELFDFIVKDKMDVRIHKVYDLKDVATAHNDIEGQDYRQASVEALNLDYTFRK
ncbi:NAD(P)-binding protein, partial [Aureobasidium pullulans]